MSRILTILGSSSTKYSMRAILFTAIFLGAAIPVFVYAQSGGLVPCSGSMCQACHLVQMGDTIVRFLISIFAVIGAILIAWAGFLMATSAGNMSKRDKGKGILMNTVIGLIIMLAAWLIVDTVMKTLAGNNQRLGTWNQVQCVDLPVYGTGATLVESIEYIDSSGKTETAAIVQGTPGCSTCVNVESSVAACKSGANCSVSSDYYERLKDIGGGLEITEGYPPTRDHKAKCHTTGYCVDIVFADRQWNTQRVNSFIAEADAAGLKAVYEPSSSGSCAGVSQCLPYSKTGATGNHFSLYMKE
jgi:hypothetical protein